MLKQKTVYFREEDLPLWDIILNKAEWLHEHLMEDNSTPTMKVYQLGTFDVKDIDKIEDAAIKAIEDPQLESEIQAKANKPITYKKTNNWGA